MTKSRTLRKAGAVVLSLAMAFSVASVNTPADAAAKVKLTGASSVKKGKTTKLTVKYGSKALAKKRVKKLTAKSSKTAVLKISSKTKNTVTVKGVKKGSSKVTVTLKLKAKLNGKKKFTLKKTVKVKAATPAPTATTDDDGTTVKESLTLVDLDGLQTDGTAALGDRLQVQVSGNIGTIDRVNWYVDDVLVSASGQSATSTTYPGADKAGSWIARVITTKGTTYTSNAIVVSDKEARAVVSDFTIADDYDDNDIDLRDKDGQAILEVTLNKDYDGTFKFFTEKDGAIDNKTAVTTLRAETDGLYYNAVTTSYYYAYKDSTETYSNHALWADSTKIATTAITTNKNAVTATAINKAVHKDGSVTYKFFAGVDLSRGQSYIALFDQDAVIDDDETSATPNISGAFTAPYVTAPTAIVINPISKNLPVSVSFVGEDGKAIAWLNNTDNAGAFANFGFENPVVYADKGNTVSTKSTAKYEVTTGLKAGTFDTGAKLADDSNAGQTFTGLSWYLADVKSKKGIFGADALPLTSTARNINTAVCTAVDVKPAADDEKQAEITLTNLGADATVYLVRGTFKEVGVEDNTCDADANMKNFDPAKDTTYSKKVEATKGTVTVKIPDAFDKGVNTEKKKGSVGNTYNVIVVPNDIENFGRVKGTQKTLEQKATKFALKDKIGYVLGTGAASTGFDPSGTFKLTATAAGTNISTTGTAVADAVDVKDQYSAAYGATGRAAITKEYHLKKSSPTGADANLDVKLVFHAVAGAFVDIQVDLTGANSKFETEGTWTATADGMTFTVKVEKVSATSTDLKATLSIA